MDPDEQIRWQVWGREAFKRSREERKPVFLSISATWCHWCHVMDGEAFDHPEVIRRLNRDFIPVRVDSDRRPDINSRYNMGGWPTVAVLDDGGQVQTGGTYLPTSQLLDLLNRVAGEALEPQRVPAPIPKDRGSVSDKGPDPEGIQEVLSWVERSYDPEYGGFGPPPKFPHPWILELILKDKKRIEDPHWRRMASFTLDVMRGSELYDPEDGGFFRYATRGDWDRPHYEKLLETNSKMLSVYLDAALILNEPTYLATARGVLDYLQTFLSDTKSPGFFGSQAAGEDYYTLSEEARLNSAPPPLDKTIYTDTNAETASVLLKAASVLGDAGLSRRGMDLADFLWEKFRDPELGMVHCDGDPSPLWGYLPDQVRMLTLLLDVFEREGGKRFKERALALLKVMNGNLWDESVGGYRDLSRQSGGEGILKMEMKPLAENSLAAMALTRLYYISGEEAFLKRAERTLGFLSGVFKPYKHHAAVFAIALERFLNPPVTVVIIGRGEDANWRRLIQAAHRMHPSKTPCWKVVVPLENEDDLAEIEKRGFHPSEKPAAHLCGGQTCLPAVYDPEDLEGLVFPGPDPGGKE